MRRDIPVWRIGGDIRDAEKRDDLRGVDDDANPQPETPLTPEEAAALGNALTFGAADLADAKPAKPLRLPGLASPNKFDVSAKPDGADTMRYYRPFAGNWDAKIGADLTLAPVQPDGYRPDKPFPIIGGSQDSGAAWASACLMSRRSTRASIRPAIKASSAPPSSIRFQSANNIR